MSEKNPKKYKNYQAGAKAGFISGVIFSLVIGVLSSAEQQLAEGHHYTSTSYFLMLIQTVIFGSLVYGPVVALFYVFLYERLPTSNAIVKAEFSIFIFQVVIFLLTDFFTHRLDYLYVITTVPSYMLLGLLMGYFYSRFRKTVASNFGKTNRRMSKTGFWL